jgi:metallophosphoesterase (TIGR00282 family)
MKILAIGDVIGRAGRKTLKKLLPEIKKEYQPDFIVANGENSAGGFGLTKKVFNELISLKIDTITSGNHIWDKKEIFDFIDEEEKLLRPANYPPLAPGRGYGIYKVKDKKIAVINLMGRVYMGIPLDCPFRKFDEIYEEIKDKVDYIIVDFHAEATSEKTAFGYYVDGRASIVYGTHSHVPTADERFLPKGTAYITDVGMTGPLHSVIGIDIKQSLTKFLTGIPKKYNIPKGDTIFNAILFDLDAIQSEIIRIQIKTRV